MASGKTKLIIYIYLLLVPVIAAGLGFGVGPVSYKIYLPIWLLNATLMVFAFWTLGRNVVPLPDANKSKLSYAAFFLILPWIFISMFAGLGPPPETPAEWTNTAIEQQVRYFILAICGVFIAFGFVTLRDSLRSKGEDFFSLQSLSAILIAIPLFIINMLYWGFYLTELFKIQTANNSANFPDWFLPLRQLFGLISVIEVALTYFATFAVAVAMRKVGWLSKSASFFYILFSLLALTVIVSSAFLTETLKVPGFAVSIPAFPFLMPYFIGVSLMRQIGNWSPGQC